METITTGIIQFLRANAFLSGLCGIVLSLSLLASLVYLFLKRNEVMTLTYGIALFSMFAYTVLCILALFLFGIYGVTLNSFSLPKTTSQKALLTVTMLLILTPLFGSAQGVNYPGNSPVNSGGAGNARTDPDNLFTRNNAAALTAIEGDEKSDDSTGRWRVMSEYHATYYQYKRDWKPLGPNSTVRSSDTILLPSGSGEMTYTAKSRRYAFGVGLSQTFGFESKMKDDEKIFGNQATFFDSRIASNDLSVAGAVKLDEKISVGGSFIVGRGFLLQTTPIQQLAANGIIRHSRLDVSQIGGIGASLNVHFRPTKAVNFGFNFKTARRYNMQGTLDSIQPTFTAQGLQLNPIQLNVRVPFKLPMIVESGIKIEPTDKLFLAFDYRFYDYAHALDTLSVIDKASSFTIATQTLNAKNVHLLSFGGGYKIGETSKILFGAGYQNSALSDAAFTPALNNAGGISFSSGISKKILGTWMNFGVTTIFSLDRTIPVSSQNLFPGYYRANGYTIGWGVRW